jgi:hypothetical protein
MDTQKFDKKKFDALLDHIIAESGTRSPAKIAVILWVSDTCAYAKFGKSLTGATYIKGKHYPIPTNARRTIR